MNKATIFIPTFADQNEYKMFYDLADDRERLNATLLEYEISANKMISELTREKFIVHRDRISISEMISWLSKRGLTNIGKNRADYFTYIAESKFCH